MKRIDCGCNRPGLSSSREFYQIKKVEVPEEGWTAENFRTRNGVELLKSLLAVRKSAVARGIRLLVTLLTKWFDGQLQDIVSRVESRARAIGAKALEGDGFVTISPTSHANMWAQAIQDAMKQADMDLIFNVTPIVQSVGVEVHRKTSLLIGAPWSDASGNSMKKRTDAIAAKVTRITETTRKRLATIIANSIDEGLTVKETIDAVREAAPSIGRGRIPTIVRTEMGRVADEATKQSLKDSTTVTHVSVVGCEAIEPNIPTYHGIPTCNIQDVPITDIDQLEFHINHTGAIVPSRFVSDEGRSDVAQPRQGLGPTVGRDGVFFDDPRPTPDVVPQEPKFAPAPK